MRRLALISAAAMMAVGSIGSAAATANTVAVGVTPGVISNRVALGLAQPAQDEGTASATEAGGGIGATGVVVAVLAVLAVGAGVAAAVSNNDTTPASS